MENKGIAFVIIAFVAVIVALSFWTTIGSSIGLMTKTYTSTNASFVLPALNTATDLGVCGQRNTSAISVWNATGNVYYPTGNYTITYAASSADGYIITKITRTGTQAGIDFAGTTAKIDCTYEPRGYINEGSGRAVVLIIPILAALAIAFAAFPDLRDFFKEQIFR